MPMKSETANVTVTVSDQWTDFLVRQYDPYAAAKYGILLDWMGELKNKSILVVGCGSGELCALLSLKGAEVDAIDIDEKFTQLAKRTASKFKTEFNTIVSSIESYSTNKTYDFVVATDVLEHIADDVLAMKKMKKLLSPTGKLVLTVPAFEALTGYHDEILGHHRRYSLQSVKDLLSRQFDIQQYRYFGFFLIPVAFLYSRLLRKPYPVMAVGQATGAKGPLGHLLTACFQFEKHINFGVGTSILLIAKPH